MQIDYKEIINGSRNGEIFYVCAYFRPDKNKKPIRSLSPIEVMVMDNSTTVKRIYYSESHFRPVSKNGSVSNRVIPVFDNTGFRSRTGNPLHIFTTEKECKSKWNEMIQEEIEKLEVHKNTVIERIQSEIDSIQSKML